MQLFSCRCLRETRSYIPLCSQFYTKYRNIKRSLTIINIPLLWACKVCFSNKRALLKSLLFNIVMHCPNCFSRDIFQHWLSNIIHCIVNFSTIKEWPDVVDQLERILSLTCSNSETLIPGVQIGVLGSLTHILQYFRSHNLNGKWELQWHLSFIQQDVAKRSGKSAD